MALITAISSSGPDICHKCRGVLQVRHCSQLYMDGPLPACLTPSASLDGTGMEGVG
jgi:hypothetical protein